MWILIESGDRWKEMLWNAHLILKVQNSAWLKCSILVGLRMELKCSCHRDKSENLKIVIDGEKFYETLT
jgi:hypothetical protein